MSAFVVNGELLTDKNKIRDKWADHFEALGSPSETEAFDKDFSIKSVIAFTSHFSPF